MDRTADRRSYGEKWARSSLAERRSWLKDAAFQVFAGKPDMLDYDAVNEHPDEALGRADWFQDGDVILYFRWRGDDAGLARGPL